MPLVAIRKRLSWQDVTPSTEEGRIAYRIAEKNQASFSRAFLRAMRNLVPDSGLPQFKEAWKASSVSEILNQLPLFQPGITDEKQKVWNGFMDSMRSAYSKVAFEAGRDALDKANEKFGLDLEFVAKATQIWNPYTRVWIENRLLELVTQGITKQQKAIVVRLLENAFSEGLRAETVYKQIQENIGLTEREYLAVQKRKVFLESQDLPKKRVKELVSAYRVQKLKERAQRIARTETIAMQSQGRHAAWQSAKNMGMLPSAVEREWISVAASPRRCEICAAMDGKRAAIGESYESDHLGSVEQPPAHPHCRCTEVLVDPDEEG